MGYAFVFGEHGIRLHFYLGPNLLALGPIHWPGTHHLASNVGSPFLRRRHWMAKCLKRICEIRVSKGDVGSVPGYVQSVNQLHVYTGVPLLQWPTCFTAFLCKKFGALICDTKSIFLWV